MRVRSMPVSQWFAISRRAFSDVAVDSASSRNMLSRGTLLYGANGGAYER